MWDAQYRLSITLVPLLDVNTFYKFTADLIDLFTSYRRCKAFICHYEAHWIALRKFANQWFNMNSLLTYPELLSDELLAMYIAQLTLEGLHFDWLWPVTIHFACTLNYCTQWTLMVTNGVAVAKRSPMSTLTSISARCKSWGSRKYHGTAIMLGTLCDKVSARISNCCALGNDPVPVFIASCTASRTTPSLT